MYNYLFYNSYVLAKKSGNFNEEPILGGILFVIPCFLFNFFSLQNLFIYSGILHNPIVEIQKPYTWVICLIIVFLVFMYYKSGGRSIKIINKYQNRSQRLPPLFVIYSIYILSFLVLLLSAMLKNGDL